jgi:hypothetical protein
MEVWQHMGRNSPSQLAPTKSLPASEGTALTRAGFPQLTASRVQAIIVESSPSKVTERYREPHRLRPSPHSGQVGSCIISFVGLLSVHSRYDLQTRQSPYATLYSGGSDGFVASTAAPIATRWSDPVPGRPPLWTSAFHGAPLWPDCDSWEDDRSWPTRGEMQARFARGRGLQQRHIGGLCGVEWSLRMIQPAHVTAGWYGQQTGASPRTTPSHGVLLPRRSVRPVVPKFPEYGSHLRLLVALPDVSRAWC